MKVLVLMPMSEQRGGGEIMLYQLMQNQHRFDIEWSVVFFQEGSLVAEFRSIGVKTYVVPTGRLRELHKFVSSIWEISRLARDIQADLIISWSGKAHLYGSLVSILTHIPSVWYQLGYPAGRHLSTLDKVATLFPARAIITLSQAGQEGQKTLWPERRTYLVYPGVELQKYDARLLPSNLDARKALGLPESGPIIGIVGRLQYWKGMHTLIKAMPHVLKVQPDAHCVIVGGRHEHEPEYESMLNNLILDLGLEGNIIMVGYQRNIPLWIQAMDIFVHASDNEPFGIVILEAMSMGKPVIAGDEGGPKEIITDGVDGLLAPFDDPDTLARQIERFLRDPDFTRRTSQAARERASVFSVENYADNFVNVINQLSVTN